MPDLKIPLFFTRIAIAAFLLPWVIMRFTKPEQAGKIAAKYYKLGGLSETLHIGIGVFWVLLLLAFVTGFKKRVSYGLVLLLHTVGTIMTIPYLLPGAADFKILFYAAIPVIGAMWLLYSLRDQDTLLSFGK